MWYPPAMSCSPTGRSLLPRQAYQICRPPRAVGDRFGWPISELLSFAVFDGADGDPVETIGVDDVFIPAIGPNLVITGSPSFGEATTVTYPNGQAATAIGFSGSQVLISATAITPGASDDIVLMVLLGVPASPTSSVFSAARFGGAPGWQAFTTTAPELRFFMTDGTVSATVVAPTTTGECLYILKASQGGTMSSYVDSGGPFSPQTSPDLTAAGRLSIGGRANGDLLFTGQVMRKLLFHGENIADLVTDSFVANLADSLGL